MRTKLAVALGIVLLFGACAKKSPDPDATGPETASTSAVDDASDDDSDLETVQNYKLTMDGVNKYYAVTRNLAAAMKKMSPEEREQSDTEMDSDDASLDEIAARLDRQPIMRKALSDAGLTAREYAVMTMALLQSGMAEAVIAMQPDADADSLARAMKANPENIQFMREHKAEIETMQQSMQAEMEGIEETE